MKQLILLVSIALAPALHAQQGDGPSPGVNTDQYVRCELHAPDTASFKEAFEYLTASSIPAVVSKTSDGRIRLDLMNGRPDSIDVLIKARRRPPS